MRREASFFSRFKYDVLLLIFLALIGVGAWLNEHPVTFDATDEEMVGAHPPSLDAGEVLLVVPGGEGKAASGFADLDFAYAWYNTLAQEVGPFRTRPPRGLDARALQGIQLLVVPASSARAFDEGQVEVVRRFVEEGGNLILEMPGPLWAPLTGIDQLVMARQSAEQITAAESSPLQSDFNKHLRDVPVHTRLMMLETVDLSAYGNKDVLLEIDGAPAHLHRKLGDGHLFMLAFDFGMAVTSLQQGRPLNDLTIPLLDDGPLPDAAASGAPDPPADDSDSDDEAEVDDETLTTPEGLVASSAMRTSLVPYADLLERHVIYSTLRYRPAPRLWHFPRARAGALIMTHDEGGFGDAALFMAQHEHAQGVRSAYFISPTEISNDALDQLHSLGVDVGLTWHRGPEAAIYAPGGVGRLQPYRTALSLAEQRARLEGWSGQRVLASRARDLAWDRAYTRTFRKLAHAGVYIDSSYGPARDGSFGYLFGTGLPFLILDDNGLLLPLYELPTLVSDVGGYGDEDDVIERLLSDSQRGFHQVITVDIDADTMARHPRAQSLDVWTRAFSLARDHDHWVTTPRDYILFHDGRRRAKMISSFDREQRALEVRVALPRVAVSDDAEALPVPAVAVPARYEGGAIKTVLVDGVPLDLEALGHSGDGILALVPITTPGHHRVSVRYAGVGGR